MHIAKHKLCCYGDRTEREVYTREEGVKVELMSAMLQQ